MEGEGLLDVPAMDPERAVALGARTLVVGVAPAGGQLPAEFIEALCRALRAGLDLASGLHTRLGALSRLRELAVRCGRSIHDVREPGRDFPVGSGAPRSGRRVLTVGTDCAVGKMYTALTIERELHRRGAAATFRATGQTGILIAGSGTQRP